MTSLVQPQLATLVNWHVLAHVTTQFCSFVLNSHWDSVCFVVGVSVSQALLRLSVKNMGNKLLEHKTNIKFSVKLEKNPLIFTKYYSKFTKREQWEQHRFLCG
jgi:hypothetical protein